MGATRKKRRRRPATQPLTALVANGQGEIFELEGYNAVGMSGVELKPLTPGDTLPLPPGSELMYLPDRHPVLWDQLQRQLVVLETNPYAPEETLHPVAAFNSPGYLLTQVTAYTEAPGADYLPLFSYGAVGWQQDGFRSAVIQVDREPRQDLRRMPPAKVQAGVRAMRRKLPANRLARHLEGCALTYGCPAGKNFFLGRYEAPLPTSRACNARCLGCLSLQPAGRIPVSQNRLGFTPRPEEVAEVALSHIERVPQAVVSFGQGCEGDPLLAAEVIEPAVRRIRAATQAGTINLNTNASRPRVLARLMKAGLDSVRISINSLRPECYEAYFRPRDYRFEDVLTSIRVGLDHGGHLALNYLNMPGFTDTPEEIAALTALLHTHPLHLIQWRNLNFDPLRYYQAMAAAELSGPSVGMARLVKQLRREFPGLRHGYFNPPREKFGAGAASLAATPNLEKRGPHELD